MTPEPTHPTGLSILVPAYNEEKTIVRILDLLFETELPDNLNREVIVVNDCSSDKTGPLLDEYRAQHPQRPLRIRHLDRNQGKGHALRTGLAMASLSYVVVQDADLEYDPKEFALLLAPLQKGGKGKSRRKMGDRRPIGIISTVAKLLEQILLPRLAAIISNSLSPDQAGEALMQQPYTYGNY